MSLVKVSGNASGTGTLTIAAPNTNSDYTLTLPQATTTLVGTDATQTLTNKTLTSPTITGAIVSTMASSVITSGTAVASTSGTSIDFTSIPSWVKRITVMLSGVSTSGTSPPLIQIGAGSVANTGYLMTATTISNAAAVASSLFTTGFALAAGTSVWSAATTVGGSIILTLVDSATATWSCNGQIGRSDVATTHFAGGSKVLSGTLDRVRITTVNGTDTFDAGSINILYE